MDTFNNIVAGFILIGGNLVLLAIVVWVITKLAKSHQRRQQRKADARLPGNSPTKRGARRQDIQRQETDHKAAESLARIDNVMGNNRLLTSPALGDKQAVAHIVNGDRQLREKFNVELNAALELARAYRSGNDKVNADDLFVAANRVEGAWNNLYHQDWNYTDKRYSEF